VLGVETPTPEKLEHKEWQCCIRGLGLTTGWKTRCDNAKLEEEEKTTPEPMLRKEERINSVSSSSLLSSGAEKQKLEHGPEPRCCADHP